MDSDEVKQELTRLLTSIFGVGIKSTIENYYESNKIDELIELAHHMLSGYMGEDNAIKTLSKFTKIEDSGTKSK